MSAARFNVANQCMVATSVDGGRQAIAATSTHNKRKKSIQVWIQQVEDFHQQLLQQQHASPPPAQGSGHGHSTS